MARIYYAPLKVVKKTGLWMPVVALTIALICAGVSGMKARNAAQLEQFGVTTTGVVTNRERRESTDSEGRRQVRYYVSYRFVGAGQTISRRVRVNLRYYNSVSVNQPIPIRYHPQRPRLHEYNIGSNRRDATMMAGFSGLGGAATLGLVIWVFLKSGPLFRALKLGEVRQATVLEHIAKGRRRNSGRRKGRLRWRDDQGAVGVSGTVPMLDVVSHPVGSRIRVVIDPRTGRGYWEEELAGGDDGMVNPFSN